MHVYERREMKPVSFPQQTAVLAKNQPPYLPLPVCVVDDRTISCWHLGWRERFRVLLRGRVWLQQLNFRGPLQPQKPTTESPFEEPD